METFDQFISDFTGHTMNCGWWTVGTCDCQPTRVNLREHFLGRIAAELDRAYAKHGKEQWGRHEFYGILKEEVDELWADIKSDAAQDVLEKELVQVAAMCFRYFETRDRYREPAGDRTELAAPHEMPRRDDREDPRHDPRWVG